MIRSESTAFEWNQTSCSPRHHPSTLFGFLLGENSSVVKVIIQSWNPEVIVHMLYTFLQTVLIFLATIYACLLLRWVCDSQRSPLRGAALVVYET
jgi:Flp pilus assembly protein TadB